MKQIMKHKILLAACLLCVTVSAVAEDTMMEYTYNRYQANELNVDLFGSESVGQKTLDHLSGARIRDNGRLGAGVGVSYFFTRNIGVGVDAYAADVNHHFVDSASANLIVRFPLGNSGFAPYVLGGGGRQFDPTRLWFAQAGAGLEYRFCRNVGLFTDGRYVITERAPNYGLFRLGVRLAF